MKQNSKRLMSLLLVLALCFSFVLTGMPKAAAADYWWLPYVETPDETFLAPGVNVETGQVTSEGRYILLTSDVHRYAYLLKDLLQQANAEVKAEGLEDHVGFLAMGGDYANEYDIYADNMTIMKHAVEDNSPGTVVAYSKGNHEGSVNDQGFIDYTGMKRIGETAVNKDGLYYYYNWGAENKNQRFLLSDIEALDLWLAEHNDGKPIFLVSHFPIHYYNARRVTENAGALMDVLNKYPQTVFCWGHNHTEHDPAYGTIRTPGDVIQYGPDPLTETKELNFTYVNLGALRDGVNDCNGLVAKVNDDHSVTYKYLSLDLKEEEDSWTDAQGNVNPVKTPQNPHVVSVTEVAPLTPESLKNIERASIRVDRPLVDDTPAAEARVFSDRFESGEIIWTKTESGDPVEGVFDFDTAYSAQVDLVAKEGYAFTDDAKGLVNFAYIGPMGEYYPVSDAEVLGLNENVMTLKVGFDPTVKQRATSLTAVAGPVELKDGHQYALVAVDNKFAVYYQYDPDEHGEEVTRPDLGVKAADVVIRDGKIVSELDPFVVFTAAKDGHGYLLYSDASLKSCEGATTLNFLTMGIRGGGEMNFEGAEEAGMSIYNNWNVDSEGYPYLNVDGAICYPMYDASSGAGAFAGTTDKSACNVRLFEVGVAEENESYVISAEVPAPRTGETPAEGVIWSPAAETFAPATAYTVAVEVALDKPASAAAVGRINGNAADVTISEDGMTAILTYTFGATLADPVPIVTEGSKKADTLEAGKTYALVAEGKAVTSRFEDGLYLAGADVTVENDAIVSEMTEEMLFTFEATDTEGVFYIKSSDGYLMGKQVGDSPDCWGITTSETPAMTVSYSEGLIEVVATGIQGGPPPGGTAPANYIYCNNGHFNFMTLQSDEIALYEVKTAYKNPYVDITGHWAESYILAASEAGLFNGTTETTFEPGAPLSRAMVVTVLYRMTGEPAVEETAGFEDVKADHWYTDAVNWAAAEGIVLGIGDNKFGTDNPITRQDFTTILARYADSQGLTLEGDNTAEFIDADKIADYAADAVDACVKAGIIIGRDTGEFDPTGNLVRAEAAKMIVVFGEVAK